MKKKEVAFPLHVMLYTMLSVLPHILAKRKNNVYLLFILCILSASVSQRDILKAVKHFPIAIFFLIYKILSEEVTKILML